MNKLTIPVILVATVMVAGVFAFMPVQEASTVHTTILGGTSGIVCVTENVAALATTDNDIITYTFSQPVVLRSAILNEDATLAGDTLDFDVGSVDGGDTDVVTTDSADVTDSTTVNWAFDQDLVGLAIQNTLALTINSANVDVDDVISFTFCVETADPANFDTSDITTATTAV